MAAQQFGRVISGRQRLTLAMGCSSARRPDFRRRAWWRGVALWLLCCGPLFGASPAQAQIVNILAKLKSKGDAGFAGGVSASLAWKKGNTELLQVKGNLGLAYRHGPQTLFLLAAGSYGLKGEEVVVSQLFEHLRFRHSFSEWLQGEGFAQHEQDRFRRLSLRLVGGAGPRLSWSWTAAPAALSSDAAGQGSPPSTGLSLAVAVASALMVEREAYTGDGSAATAGRWSSYLQADVFFSKSLSLHHTTFIQPRLDAFADIRLLSQTALAVKANSWLGVKLSFHANYDSRPPAAVERLDLSVDSALTATF